MSSATGIPEQNPARDEEEPLLGRPGDATQGPQQNIFYNFLTGTSVLTQAGIWILFALIYAGVFEHDVIFFSYHPLMMILGVLFLVQAIVVVQPTATAQQKKTGTWVHSGLNALSLAALIAGLVVIEMNKASHPETRFQDVHGKLGLLTFILIALQATVGFIQYWVPSLVLGSVDRGKAIYKYHRISGYVIVLLSLATVCAATQTAFNKNMLHIRLWAVLVASLLVIFGLAPRIKKHKLGF